MRNLYFVDNNTVVVDLTKAVGLLKVSPTDLIIKGNVVAFAKTGNSKVDILNLCIHMHKNNVIVVNEYVQQQQEKLNQ